MNKAKPILVRVYHQRLTTEEIEQIKMQLKDVSQYFYGDSDW